MGGPRAARLPVGSAPWVAEERSSAQQIEQTEVDEFSFSARNEFDWLHEHMADIFSDNQINVAEIFKTPGKLRGKTPRTVRKLDHLAENRAPLADIFSSSPKRAVNSTTLQDQARTTTPDIFIRADSQISPIRPNPVPTTAHSAQDEITAPKPFSVIDSGYHGSQSQDTVANDDVSIGFSDPLLMSTPAVSKAAKTGRVAFENSPERIKRIERQSPDATVEAATEPTTTQYFTAHGAVDIFPVARAGPDSTTPTGSPAHGAVSSSAAATSPPQPTPAVPEAPHEDEAVDMAVDEPSGSTSDGSSPIRPMPIRKNSMSFAALPARQPMGNRSTGGQRTSRTSHIGQNRTSYYNRPTGGKSLGRARLDTSDDEVDEDADKPVEEPAINHTKRLQDQINMLGQSKAAASRPPQKSVSGSLNAQLVHSEAPITQSTAKSRPPSPIKKPTTPGAFPEDDDDDWNEPLGSPDGASNNFSPRPNLPKYHSADVMEGVAGKQTVGGSQFANQTMQEPLERPPVPPKPASAMGHQKSASVSVLQKSPSRTDLDQTNRLKKIVSASSTNLAMVSEDGRPTTPLKSPTRGFRDSPLKSVKSAWGSLMNRAKELAASGDALSEYHTKGSFSMSSPKLLSLKGAPSTETLSRSSKDLQYPDLTRHAGAYANAAPSSPTRSEAIRAKASVELERAEEKRREKEAKEAQRAADEMAKLEKAREQVREQARAFSKEKEKVAAMEEQMAQKQQESKVAPPAAAPTPSQPQKSTRSSPRKAKPHAETDETHDIDMADVPAPMPPPSVPRTIAPPSAARTREIKRPLRPEKDVPKKLPTVIRVNMGSQQPQHHPSNATLANNLHDTFNGGSQSQSEKSQLQVESRIGQPTLQHKASQSFASSTSSAAPGRSKVQAAAAAAAKKKELEERDAQRKRDAKAEADRKKRAAQEEEKRMKKLELERQQEEERKQAEAKKKAQRQAMLEKAKETRAPPPAKRNQPTPQADGGVPRPPSRMAPAAARSQEDLGRSIHSSQKAAQKRPLQQPNTESRPGTSAQAAETKRMRMTNDFDDDGEVQRQSTIKGAPVRPSAGFKKDVGPKAMFPAGYANAAQSTSNNLFKSQMKPGQPLDHAKLANGSIPFAQASNAAGSSFKTPARPQANALMKSAIKSSAAKQSPRFQNGENIELPEINTDDESDDEYDDPKAHLRPDWANSSPLMEELARQEGRDVFGIFGPPKALNMEEVFPKSKDRFHKFRMRTSSANWSGADRLTEDEIRKDQAAREKMLRDGAWSYEMSKDLA